MSELIFAVIWIMVGGAGGVLVGSMLTVSKRADEDVRIECDPENCTYRGKETL